MSVPSGLVEYQRSYRTSPIVLVGGLAEGLPGNVLPIISLMSAQDFPGGPTQSADSEGPTDQFAFSPLSGATAIDNQIGAYPFANQSVAANAIITQPLAISLQLLWPVNTRGGYQARLAAFTNLQNQLAKHNNAGGLYNIATPSFLYTNCIMLRLTDATGGDGKQVQSAWRFDFVQPLLTLEAAQAAMNLLMKKIDMGLPVSGDPPSPSGQQVGVGSSATLQGPSVVPAAQPLGGAAGSGAG